MKRADFHTEGVTFILIEDTVLLILQLMDEWAPTTSCFFLPTRDDGLFSLPNALFRAGKVVISHTMHPDNSVVTAH